MLIIAIDPGISGSLCFFDDGKIIDLIEMPSMAEGKKNKRQVNGSQVYNEISSRIKNYEKWSNKHYSRFDYNGNNAIDLIKQILARNYFHFILHPELGYCLLGPSPVSEI